MPDDILIPPPHELAPTEAGRVGLPETGLAGLRLAAEALVEHSHPRLIDRVIHRARTPLATIKMNAEMLAGAPGLGEKDKGCIARIDRAARRLQDLFGELGREKLVAPELRSQPAAALIEQIVAQVQEAAGHPLSLRASLDAQTRIAADRSLLELALLNLVLVAARDQEAGAAIEILCGGAQEAVEVTVLAAEQEFGRGFGFRLYIVGLVAEAHGGDLYIAAPRRGEAILTLSLPRSDARR